MSCSALSTLTGLIYFNELHELRGLAAVFFSLGFALIITGVALLAQRTVQSHVYLASLSPVNVRHARAFTDSFVTDTSFASHTPFVTNADWSPGRVSQASVRPVRVVHAGVRHERASSAILDERVYRMTV